VISKKQPADTWAGTKSHKERLTSVIRVQCTKPVVDFQSYTTVNHCHYEDDTIIIQMALSKEIRGLCFYVWFVRQIIEALLHFPNITQNACISNGQESMVVQK